MATMTAPASARAAAPWLRASLVAETQSFECATDAVLVATPRAEAQIVVRFGGAASDGLDMHAMGALRVAHRKVIRGRRRAVTARLALGSVEAALGVSASALTDRIVPLELLWQPTETRRLRERLEAAPTLAAAGQLLAMAIDERANQPGAAARARDDHALAQRAAALLATARVGEAAASLGVSERHLRRLFRDAIGLGPKAFARLTRFRRAIHTATQAKNPRWAEVASFAGYYDQAHLIAEFRALAGATPEAFVAELRRTAQQSPPSSGALASART